MKISGLMQTFDAELLFPLRAEILSRKITICSLYEQKPVYTILLPHKGGIYRGAILAIIYLRYYYQTKEIHTKVP